MRIIEHTNSFHPISAGAASFLVIVLDGFGNIEVDYKTDIRLIDAHTKGDGCHYHLHMLIQKLILPVGTEFLI